MAETSFPVAGGQGVTEATYEALIAQAMGAGRIPFSGVGASEALMTSPIVFADSTGRQYKVNSNVAFQMRGFRWENGPATLVRPLAANTSGKTRIDRVVLRLDRSTWMVRLADLPGTPADVPAPPAVTQQLGSTGVFEIPIAQIKVTSSTTTGQPSIAATDVTPEDTWLTQRGLTGLSRMRPSPLPLGQPYFETDTGRAFMGAVGGDILVGENGPYTKLPIASGWKNDALYAQRVNGLTYLQCIVQSNASAKAPNTALAVAALAAAFRPIADVSFPVWMTPGQIGVAAIDAATGVFSVLTYATTFPLNGQIVIPTMSYPSTGVKRT